MKNHDPALSSNNVADSSSYRCIITARFPPTAGQEEAEFKTFGLEPCDVVASERLFDQVYTVVEANAFTVKRSGSDIVDLEENPEGCVCLCSWDRQDDVNAALRIATEKGAVAFLTKKRPTEVPTSKQIPVFLATSIGMNQLSHRKGTTVMIERIPCDEDDSAKVSPNDTGLQQNARHDAAFDPFSVFDDPLSDFDVNEPGTTTHDTASREEESMAYSADVANKPAETWQSGSTTSASEKASEGSSTVRQNSSPIYEVTMKGQSENDGVKILTVIVKAASEVSRSLIVPNKVFMTMVAQVTRNGIGEVRKLNRDPKDRVLSYESENVEDIHRVQKLACEGGAVALFVPTVPGLHENIPVFRVDRTILQEMSRMQLGTAKFELFRVPKEPSSNIEHPLAPPSRAYAEAAARASEGKYCSPAIPPQPHAIRDRRGTFTASSAGNSCRNISAIDPSPETFTSGKKRPTALGSKGSEKKSKKTFLENMIEVGGRLLFGQEALFVPLNDFSEKAVLTSYRDVVKKIDRLFKSGNKSDIQKLLSEAETFLKKQRWSLCHLVASAYICSKKPGEVSLKLGALVIECIAKFRNFTVEGELLKKKRLEGIPHPNMPRNVMYGFLLEHIDSVLKSRVRPGDVALMKQVLLLHECGLFDRKFQPQTWRWLRAYCHSGVFVGKEGSLFTTVLDERATRTLVLCFQKDLIAFVEKALEYEDSMDDFFRSRQTFWGEIFLLLVRDKLGGISDEDDLLSTWSVCLALLDRKPFNQQTCTKILSEFIGKATWKSFCGYSAILGLLDSVDPTHPYHQTIRHITKKQLSEDLMSRQLDWVAMNSLLRKPRLASLLSSPELRSTTLEFVDRLTLKWPFEHRLALIDAVLRLFVQDKKSFFLYERHLRSQLEQVVRTENETSARDTTLLVDFLRVISTDRHLFVVLNSEIAFNAVAESFVSAKSVMGVAREPSSLGSVEYIESRDAKLYHFTLSLLCQRVLTQCDTMDDALSFYSAVGKESPSVSPVLRSIANTVFVEMFKKWSPAQFTDIQPGHKKVIDTLFLEFLEEAETNHNVTRCREHLRLLLVSSLELYSSEDVSRTSLEHMLAASKSQLWRNAESFYSIKFPTPSEIEVKLFKIDALEDSIGRSLSISVDHQTFPLAEVFRDYNCVDEGIEDLLREYEYLFQDPLRRRSTAKTLRDMANDDRLAAELAASRQREFRICSYFVAHQSLIFRDRVMRNDGHQHSVASLCDSVRSAVSWFDTAFGPNSNYAGVGSAKNSISSLKSTLDAELDVLVQCTEMNISSLDIENFQLVLLLSDLSLPLRGFISCCVKFGFKVVQADDSFVDLQSTVEAFYEADPEVVGVDECIKFSRCLCRILLPTVDPELGDHVSRGLLPFTPVLNLFSSISLFPELWSFVSEMEWFGEKGLKMFYEEYGNVTNVLLGDSESYEMSLLDAMEPVIRVVSAMGFLRDSSSNILSLLENCASHEDIQVALRGGIDTHIGQVHSKLSEIKDWFSSGVDEIAAAHTQFSAANRSGSYSITGRDSEKSSGVGLDPFGEYLLTLTFEIDNGDSKTVRKLHGEALDQFIQQLSLIQNEKCETAMEMQGFVDQYQVLARASHNVLTMFSVGYEKARLPDFGCDAGSRFGEDATKILKASEAHLRSFNSWLTSTKENFKESLLFFTEELRDLYNQIQGVGHSPITPPVLLESLSRLHPLWNNEKLEQDTLLADAVNKCAATFCRRTSAESSSWLVEVSRFLNELCLDLRDEKATYAISRQSAIVLHSYCCTDGEEAQMVLQILHHIYKNRPPWSFEVLDGAVPCSCHRMALFLDRVKAFPEFSFVIVNANLLESKTLEKLLSFLSDREIATLGISFHCVQRGETLHTAPWMSERTWDSDVMNHTPPNCTWSHMFSELSVVSSAASGSGKTRYIRDIFKSADQSTTQVASIVIHERSSAGSLIRSLKDKFRGVCQYRLLHVSFTFLPFREKRYEKWLREMNYFFFCLIALSSVYDPTSTATFSVAGTWRIFF